MRKCLFVLFGVWPLVEKWTALFSAHGIVPLAKFLCVLLPESLFCPLSSISLGLLFCKITALLYQFDVVSLISVLHWSDRFGSLQSVVPLQSDASSVVFHPTERYSWHSARAFSSLLQLHVHVATCVILVNRLLIVLRLVACTL